MALKTGLPITPEDCVSVHSEVLALQRQGWHASRWTAPLESLVPQQVRMRQQEMLGATGDDLRCASLAAQFLRGPRNCKVTRVTVLSYPGEAPFPGGCFIAGFSYYSTVFLIGADVDWERKEVRI